MGLAKASRGLAALRLFLFTGNFQAAALRPPRAAGFHIKCEPVRERERKKVK